MKNQFELVFVTTCNNLLSIYNLLESVSRGNQGVKLLIVVVCQRGLHLNSREYQTAYTQITTIENAGGLSLSSARNIALRNIQEEQVGYNYLMFPDDDSTYDSHFFERWNDAEEGNKLIHVRFADKDGYFNFLKLPEGSRIASSQYPMASSVNMIIDKPTVDRVGLFDERLGVGAVYGAGEDSDYFIRSNNIAPFRICTGLYNMHPSPQHKYSCLSLNQTVKRFNRYGRGMIFTLCKNHMKWGAFKLCVRALGGIAVSISRFRFKLAIAYFLSFFSRTILLLKLLPKSQL